MAVSLVEMDSPGIAMLPGNLYWISNQGVWLDFKFGVKKLFNMYCTDSYAEYYNGLLVIRVVSCFVKVMLIR